MGTDCDYFFLSSTAKEMWKTNDEIGLNKMFACLVKIYKESFFRRVIYKTKNVPEYMLHELAENVFVSAWESFNKKGITGETEIAGIEYTGFLFTIFKRAYLKGLEKAIRQSKEENLYGRMQSQDTETDFGIKKDESFSVRAQKTLNKISPDCKDLLIWKHVQGLSHDEIAARRKIDRDSSIKMLSRCAKRFREIYADFKNLP
jgi:DNA-directed RNA polymerase specialized sigma24 family protein